MARTPFCALHSTQDVCNFEILSRSPPLRTFPLRTLASAALLFVCVQPLLRAQTASLAPVEDRRKALNSLFKEYWDAYMEHSPEFASAIGDDRFNDKISDYSVKAQNEWLAEEQNRLLQLAAIDPTGVSEQEKTSRDLLLRDLAD